MKSCIILLILGISQSSCQGSKPFFRSDYTYFEEFNAFFKYSKIRNSWTEAAAYCTYEGGEIWTPRTKNEADKIMEFIGPRDIWIGIHDLFSHGHFILLDGTASEDVYTNWRSGEPSGKGAGQDNEDCVTIEPSGAYNDLSCKRVLPYVCKRSASNIGWNEVCQTYDTAYKYNIDTDHCYKYHTDPMNWHSAYKVCRAEQGNLVVINSQEEAKYLVDLIKTFPPSNLNENFDKGLILVGFSDIINEGTYVTVDGKLLSMSGYNDWGDYQPDNYENKEDCGSMFLNGKLNDIKCETKAFFVCERIV